MLELAVGENELIGTDRTQFLAEGRVDGLVIFDALALEVGFLDHTHKYDEEDGNS